MIDYSQSIIDMRKALLKFENFANRQDWVNAQTEVAKLKSSVTILQKLIKEHVQE
jgi:hypothetical protein